MSRPKSSYTLWILSHAARALFTLLIAFICGFLIWRVAFSQRPPKELRQLGTNEALLAAFQEHDGKLTVLEQPSQVSYTEAEDNQAYFRYDWCIFIEEVDQIQLLFFYNHSTLEKVAAEHGLSALPAGEEVFDVVLTQYIDVSPADHTGDPVTDKLELAPTSCEVGTNRTGMYTFLRYTFDGVELTDTVVIYLDVFVDGVERSLGTLRLYHHENPSEVRALTRKEEKALRGE